MPKVPKTYQGEAVLPPDPTCGRTTRPPWALACEGKVAKYALNYYNVAPATQ